MLGLLLLMALLGSGSSSRAAPAPPPAPVKKLFTTGPTKVFMPQQAVSLPRASRSPSGAATLMWVLVTLAVSGLLFSLGFMLGEYLRETHDREAAAKEPETHVVTPARTGTARVAAP